MEKNQMKRTVKKLFLKADKVSRGVIDFGGYAVTFFLCLAFKSALDSKNDNGDNDKTTMNIKNSP